MRVLLTAGLLLAVAGCASTPTATTAPTPAGPSFSLPLRLNGTEPFWGGRIASDGITISGAERPDIRLPAVTPVVTGTGARFRTPAEGTETGAPSTVVVTATFPGASAEAMNRDVVRPIESSLSALQQVHRVSSATAPGRSVITVGMLPGGGAQAAGELVRQRLASARLPARAAASVTLAAAQPVEIVLVRETCSDGMSDRRYPFQATVTFGGETLRGCAIPEAQWGAGS
jgi:uncharacterized membrane protein